MSHAAKCSGLLLLLVLVVKGNEESACDRARLPHDLDILTYAERERTKEEIHLTGEYRLYRDEAAPGGGIVHTMQLCKKCTADAHFRFSVTPHDQFDFVLTLRDGTGEPLMTSQAGGKTVSKTISYLLKQGGTYDLDIWYDSEPVECAAVFIELAMKEGTITDNFCHVGVPPTDDDKRPIAFDFSNTKNPEKFYSFETSMAHPRPTAAGWDIDFTGFPLVAPVLPGHDGQWRFRFDLRTEFISGGDLTAFVSNRETRPELNECNKEGTVCAFGARGRWKNMYSIDMTIRSGTKWYVHFFRLVSEEDKAIEEGEKIVPPCVRYWFKAQLRAETLQENFMSCDAEPLPLSLNHPGYYDDRTGEMALDMELLLSTVSTSQTATIRPSFNSIFKLTVSHETIDVDVWLFKGTNQIATSEGILKPEGITARLEANTDYHVAVSHNFDYIRFEDGWKPNCNRALLRMEIAKEDNVPCSEGNILPTLKITHEMDYKSEQQEFIFNYGASTVTDGEQEVIKAWDFELQSERLLQLSIPHDYVRGEVAATLTTLHSLEVQVTQFIFYSDSNLPYNTETTKNRDINLEVTCKECAPSFGEGPENVISPDASTKWLSFTKAPLVFDFHQNVTISKYQFKTGNDYENRDPVQWEIWGSDTEDWLKDGELLQKQDTNFATPLLRKHPTPMIELSRPQTFRYFVFRVTETRDYLEGRDITYADSDLDGTFLSKVLPLGRYRLALTTGWGRVYPKVDNSGIPKCVNFGMSLLVTESRCELKRLPSHLGVIASRAYLFGEYRVPPTKVWSIHFEVTKPSMLNLDVVSGAVNVSSIVLQNKDGAAAGSEDYYKNGLHWMMSKLEATNYTLTFNFAGEVHACDNMNLQVSIMELPSSTGKSADAPDIRKMKINGDDGMVKLPFTLNVVYQYGVDKQDHFHHEMHLMEPAEIRILITFNFEFLHVYVDICQCSDRKYAKCFDCGKARGYSVFNGNHLEAQTLPAGYYIVKFYETTYSEDLLNKVSYYNKFAVNINIEAQDKQAEDQIMCGHQPLPSHLNGPGMIDEHSLEKNTLHTIAEALVPEPVPGSSVRTSDTFFEVHTLSIFRMWVPLKKGLKTAARLVKMESDRPEPEDHTWPAGSTPGVGVVKNDGEALYHVLKKGHYKFSLTFTTDLSLDCITYDIELSLTPIDGKKAGSFNTTCPKDSFFPNELNSRGHDFKTRSIPDLGEDKKPSGNRFRHIIPFEITSMQGGRVDIDLVSTFESGGLTAEVRDATSKETVLYPIRYLHRDFIQQDLYMGSYELVVQDMASQAENIEVVNVVTGVSEVKAMCNRYSIHLRYDDYKDESCTLHAVDGPPEEAISNYETTHKIDYYKYMRFPTETQSIELDFKVSTPGTVFKVWTRSFPSLITVSVLLNGMEEYSGSATGGLSTIVNKPGSYTLLLYFVTEIEEFDLDASLACDEKVLYETYDLAIGYYANALSQGLLGVPSCSDIPAPPTELTLTTALPGAVSSHFQLAANKQLEYSHTVKLQVAETLKGGHFYVVFKWNWYVADASIVLKHLEDDTILFEPSMVVDTTQEEGYTSAMRIQGEIMREGDYQLEITGTTVEPRSCFTFYLSALATPIDSEAHIEVVDPWEAKDVIPVEPLVVRLVLSVPAQPSDVRAKKFAYLEDQAGNKVPPSRVTYDTSPTVLRVEFPVTYDKTYSLKLAASQLKTSSGSAFSSARVDKKQLKYTTSTCSCIDSIHCAWGSPCGVAGCTCRTCPEGALPITASRTTCKKDEGNGTPEPTSKIMPTAPPTRAPATLAPPVVKTPADSTSSGSSGGSNGGSNGGSSDGGSDNSDSGKVPVKPPHESDGGSKGSGKAWVIVFVLLLLMGGLVFLAHKKGFVSIPCLSRDPGPRMVRMADDSLFMDEDDDEEEPVGAGDEDGEGGQPMLEIRDQDEVVENETEQPEPPQPEPSQPEPTPQPPVSESDPFAGLDFSAPAPAPRAEP